MFVLDQSRTGISRSVSKGIIAVFRSINEPKVTVAGRSSEAARAYLCELQGAGGQVDVEVILHFPRSGACCLYRSEGKAAAKGEAESDALDFVESMGFLMDNLNLAKMKPSEREGTLGSLPIFEKVPEVPKAPEEPRDDSVSLRDLEAEFLRDDSELAEVDSALDSLMDPKMQEGPQVPAALAGDPAGEEERWRTVVRFLSSF